MAYYVMKVSGRKLRLEEIPPYKPFSTEAAALAKAKDVVEKLRKSKSLYGFGIFVVKEIHNLSTTMR
jgi:hypothetical protein